MILSINVVYFLLDYEGAKDYEGPCLKLEAVIMKVPSLKLNAVIMMGSMIMKIPTYTGSKKDLAVLQFMN